MAPKIQGTTYKPPKPFQRLFLHLCSSNLSCPPSKTKPTFTLQKASDPPNVGSGNHAPSQVFGPSLGLAGHVGG